MSKHLELTEAYWTPAPEPGKLGYFSIDTPEHRGAIRVYASSFEEGQGVSRYLVKAVNNHDELVGVLKIVENNLDTLDLSIRTGAINLPALTESIGRIASVLSKIDGKTDSGKNSSKYEQIASRLEQRAIDRDKEILDGTGPEDEEWRYKIDGEERVPKDDSFLRLAEADRDRQEETP